MHFIKKVLILFAVGCFVLCSSGAALHAADTGNQININSASVEELVNLDRIGPQYAQRIVEYREANGPFQQPEDIMKVKGIGQKTFEANKEVIVVKESEVEVAE